MNYKRPQWFEFWPCVSSFLLFCIWKQLNAFDSYHLQHYNPGWCELDEKKMWLQVFPPKWKYNTKTAAILLTYPLPSDDSRLALDSLKLNNIRRLSSCWMCIFFTGISSEMEDIWSTSDIMQSFFEFKVESALNLAWTRSARSSWERLVRACRVWW